MTLDLLTVPCLHDNYAFILYDQARDITVLVDAPEAGPIEAALDARGRGLTDILLTHHHSDHIGGVAALRARYGARVIGAAADSHRLPPLDLAVRPGESLEVAGEPLSVIDVPGHTIGHVAYHFARSGFLFTGDSLMALGCGRLNEGTPAQMWQSLQTLAALPEATEVCSGHEYTANNGKFALTIEPGNAALISRIDAVTVARGANKPTVPSALALEIATNPFLRAGQAAVKASLGMAGAPDVEVFGKLRALKDRF